ncbi:MAG: hypothetical protein FJ038_13375 [Chloroflexi bacterium]|nr:hypothetical protein [Chloroflexota bacterium]
MTARQPPDDPRRSERQGWPFRWVDAPEQRASRDRLAQLESVRRHHHDRHWPRDAPVSWGALAGGLAFQLISILALVGHFALGAIYLVALLPDRVGGLTEWLLAVAWAGLCAFAVREWLFGRMTVVLAPIAAAALLVAAGGWPF